MNLPPDVLLTRARYVAVYPLWTMEPGEEADARARAWTMGLAEQMCFTHGPSYGTKRADPGRPISKDAIAYVPGLLPWEPGHMLWAFDMLSGAGTGHPQLVPNPEAIDITGQVFVPAAPIDHLTNGTDPHPVPPPTTVIPYREDFAQAFGLACNEVYRASGAPIDPGMVSVHSQRAAWDYYVGGLDWPLSFQKHINDFRAEYGLEPI